MHCIFPGQRVVALLPRKHVKQTKRLTIMSFTVSCLTVDINHILFTEKYAQIHSPHSNTHEAVPSHRGLCGVRKVTSGLWGPPLHLTRLLETEPVSSPPSSSDYAHAETPGTPNAPTGAGHTRDKADRLEAQQLKFILLFIINSLSHCQQMQQL